MTGLSRSTYGLWAGLAAVTFAAGVRWALRRSWEAEADEEPSDTPIDPDTSWAEALAWGATTGAVAGMGRVVARRLTAGAQDRLG